MKSKRYPKVLLLIAAVVLVLTASVSFSSSSLGQADTQCIRVSSFAPFNSLYLPKITGGDGPAWTGSTIREVTEDSGGCLRFVGETIHFTLEASERGGTATISIGNVHKGIMLYDDGTHGDSKSDDGVYEVTYVTTSQDIARSVVIVGHFVSSDGQVAPSTRSASRITITDWQSDASSIAPVFRVATEGGIGAEYAAKRGVLLFSMDRTFEQVLDLLVEYDLLLTSWIPSLMAFEVELEKGLDYEVLRLQLLAESSVEEVERNYVIEFLAPPRVIPDRLMPVRQANFMNRIRAKLGWEITRGNQNVHVAIIDTGVERNHPELRNQILRTFSCPRCGEDDWNNHGTPVAGLVAAEYGTEGLSGVAPNVKLLVFRLPRWPVTVLALDDHIMAAVREGADVINMSLGNSRCSGALRRAIDHAHSNGVILIAGAGNNGAEIQKNDQCFLNLTTTYPASFTQVLAVGATTDDESRRDDSNFGNAVIFAPGDNLLTTIAGGGYGLFSQSSGAAPQVAALAALIISANSGLSNTEVIDIITRMADILPDVGGFGRINLYRALTVASGEPDPGPDHLPDPVAGLQTSIQGGSSPQVALTWTPPSTDYSGVHIYRYESAQDDILHLEGGLIYGQSYTDNQVTADRQYQYFVFAVDSAGQESAGYVESCNLIVPLAGAHHAYAVGRLEIAARSLAVQGDYAYVGSGNRLIVIDISNPAVPQIVGQTPALPDEIEDVVVSGIYTYVANGSGGLRIFNVSDPHSPHEIGLFPLTQYQEAISVAVRGLYVYLGIDNFAGGLKIIGIANPYSPFEVGFLSAPYPHDIDLSGNYAFLPSQFGAHGFDGMLIVDISNPANPHRIAIFFQDDMGNPEGVDIQGNYAYVVETQAGQGGSGVWGGGLRVVNIVNPWNPFQVGHYNDTFRRTFDVEVEGDLAFVADAQAGLRIVDISSSYRPIEVAYSSPETVWDIEVQEGIVYLAGERFSIIRFELCDG